MKPIDHERCSERLNAYVRGALGPEETEEIRAHVAGCPMCRHEEAALIALATAPVAELSREESERLHAAVIAEIESKPNLAVAPSDATSRAPRRSWAPRIAQLMAAAAVIALAAVYLTNPAGTPLGGGDSELPAAGRDAGGRGADEDRFSEGGGAGGDTVESAPEVVGDAPADGTAVESAAGTDRETEEERGLVGAGSAGATSDDERAEEAEVTAALRANALSLGAGAGYRGQL